ncbi:MAG: hypothetical protein WAK93_08515 [Solirubrobacteraceae bacterium]
MLDLWCNRGLEDGRIAQLTGTSLDALGSRRARLTARLSQDLGYAPDDVQEALAGLAREAREPETSANDTDTDTGAAYAEHDQGSWLLRVAVPGAVIILAALVASVILLTAGASHRRAATHARGLPAPAGSAPRTTSAPQGHSASTQPLIGLPGGLAHVRGTVRRIGSGASSKLELTVASLPTPRDGHDEVWLYNSVLDSRPLGAVHPGTSVYALPPGAGRYRWIDVSLQPAGSVNHSGESELRAANPMH